MPEKYFRVYAEHGEIDNTPETLNGDGVADVLKLSNLESVGISNKTFTGSPTENDIDAVRGGPYSFGPNYHHSKPGVSNITAKANIQGLYLRGNFGTLEWGQFSIYDKFFKLPKSKGLRFEEGATGTVTIWYGEVPKQVPAGVKIKKINSVVVYAYFLFRSIQLSITGK